MTKWHVKSNYCSHVDYFKLFVDNDRQLTFLTTVAITIGDNVSLKVEL